MLRTYLGAHSSYWFILADVATSVIMSVTGAAPFNGASDQSLSVAYISAFILVFLVNFLISLRALHLK
jgi:cytochrome b subunit of formate dehydrogenase